MEGKVWSATLLSQTEALFAAAKWMNTISLHSQMQRTYVDAHFGNKNNWFYCNSFLKPDPHHFSAASDHSHWTKPVWTFLEWTCSISNCIFVIDILLFRDTARTLEDHLSCTQCHNSSAERQNPAKSQDIFLRTLKCAGIRVFLKKQPQTLLAGESACVYQSLLSGTTILLLNMIIFHPKCWKD